MLALKFTQKLFKDMKASPSELGEVDPLFSWHVNILQLRKKHIIFVNDLTRLCLIIDGIRSSQLDKLQSKFQLELKQYLTIAGLKKTHINQYFLESGETSIGKTNDKSVLGTMTEMSRYSADVEFDHPIDLSVWLNKLIYKPIDYEEPIKVFKETIRNRYM